MDISSCSSSGRFLYLPPPPPRFVYPGNLQLHGTGLAKFLRQPGWWISLDFFPGEIFRSTQIPIGSWKLENSERDEVKNMESTQILLFKRFHVFFRLTYCAGRKRYGWYNLWLLRKIWSTHHTEKIQAWQLTSFNKRLSSRPYKRRTKGPKDRLVERLG